MTTLSGKIYVAGHRGMVGSAVCRRLAAAGTCEVLTASREALDLTHQSSVEDFFAEEKPDTVIFAAARVGGVLANDTYPVEFLADNLLMSTFAINAAYASGVKRFLFLGSTCIYPRDCAQPIQENALLSGPLEKTNEAYALAKIAGLKLCQYYRRQHGVMFHSAMPTNLYGPGDNYHPQHSHVLPALLRRFHEAKIAGSPSVTIWGTGTPRREFLFVDDLADALLFLLGQDNPPDWVNLGTGIDLSILELAQLVAKTVGYEGAVKTDPEKPDGTPIKCSDVSLLHRMGWKHKVELTQGLRTTYDHFLSEVESGEIRSV
ncbi:GDP-L-fucose synthase [Novipirellula galeiformis]|uniref:GDP-L-fucose synthase n=1 Tax=Novipirellula galeiformis TaxID=2528004 RepID=A0A5C6CPQ2_9BACT|nr:GDP-L-fucose synthase [Novipirellula galeiformis]TWU25454.1 GDP-L-fucose synthase [Novipirellula galeiformis]